MIETDINYPAGLPNPLREGHTASRVSPFARSPMVSGRARQRRMFTSVPSIDTYNWIFTDEQAAIFESWFAFDISDGTEWFNIRRRTPLGMSTLVCRFVDMYRGPNLFGIGRWRISAELEAYERPLMTPEAYDLLKAYGSWATVHAVFNELEKLVNEDWPS